MKSICLNQINFQTRRWGDDGNLAGLREMSFCASQSVWMLSAIRKAVPSISSGFTYLRTAGGLLVEYILVPLHSPFFFFLANMSRKVLQKRVFDRTADSLNSVCPRSDPEEQCVSLQISPCNQRSPLLNPSGRPPCNLQQRSDCALGDITSTTIYPFCLNKQTSVSTAHSSLQKMKFVALFFYDKGEWF